MSLFKIVDKETGKSYGTQRADDAAQATHKFKMSSQHKNVKAVEIKEKSSKVKNKWFN